MNRLNKWLSRWLPDWAAEQLEAENRRLAERVRELKGENARLHAYLDGLEVGLRAQRRVIVQTGGKEISETALFEAASIAAYHSKGRQSENVPVDYVQVKYVKKPAGAKPGMVIFTNNRTLWVNPVLPEQTN